jgi:predicted nucleic acid-binding protein
MKFEKIMVDTSVWIDFFRKGVSQASKDLTTYIELDLVFICGVIELEIIQGLRDNEKEQVMSAMEVVNFIELNRKDYIEAGYLLNKLRKSGITIPPTDAIIATCSIRNNLKLISYDKDFNHIKSLNKYIYKH